MCDKAVDFYLITLKLVPNWFVTNKMLKKLGNYIFSNSNIIFHALDSNFITFLTNDMGFNTMELNNINLDDDNFDEDDPQTIMHVRLTTWYNRFKQLKACKKEISNELIPVA